MATTYKLPRQILTTKSGRHQTVIAQSGHHNNNHPYLVLINSFATTIDLFAPQFENASLRAAANLLAIGLLGHEAETTRLGVPHDTITYWDQADLILDVLDTLNIQHFILYGCSQGGFIAARVALRDPARCLGILSFGSTMLGDSSESDYAFTSFFEDLCDEIHAGTQSSAFTVPQRFKDWLLRIGWNEDAAAVKEFWSASLDERFSGSAGARKLWMILVTIKERDDLVCRLKDLSCPFWVIHGQQDMAIPVEAVKRELKYIAHIKNTRFEVIPNGTHFLTQSKPEACDSFALNMIKVMNSI